MMAIRIQRKRTKGWRMPANTVYVGRPSKWGNPFEIDKPLNKSGQTVDRQGAVELYRFRLESAGAMGSPFPVSELCGKNLACWCPLSEPCHADVLLEVAN